jgi:proteasome lid subunit RPN8/RPN11
MQRLTLTPAQVKQMITHARTEAPLEACGLLGGKNGRVLRVYPTVNALHSPTRYLIDPEQLLDVLEAMEAEGWGPDPLAIYHSHPGGPEKPSQTDINESYYPNSIYIIIAHPERPKLSLRGFRILDGRVREVELVILSDQQHDQDPQPGAEGGV